MSRKMLIDASHREETRVVVVENNRVEEFDYESASKKPIRGNIYLARVTRIEPSLQAAFVEYGGNRHGFLAFNEIHPDYYQIPHEDREALRAKEEEITGETHENDEENGEEDAETQSISDEDELIDEVANKRRNFLRNYKIQEVIKRRQVLLVQVVKEERGNKGAALTTYLSLAGRYCVLMPNTARGGGISRKITNVNDRKRLKKSVSELAVPKGMGLIIRTAGASRTKIEIKRDYDYLIRLWESIRTTTLESSAPSLIYEEGNLVKRTIRDLYDKEIDEVLIHGDVAYKEAKGFMRMLMPSHAKKVQAYKDDTPLFLRYQVESQLEAIHSPTAQLKSGGYIVINPTEALVSIDVNSGRSTRERNIEQTALQTNLEAAEEAARQMRLRDLAGLLVIDFIDMEENKNVRAVEKRTKEALKRDRARLQIGKISQFGLMEMSRQRRRTSLVEGSTDICPHCNGTGHVRSIESSALVALRTLEEEGVKNRVAHIKLACPTDVALYMLNDKRDNLKLIEDRYDMRITITADDTLVRPDCGVERVETRHASDASEDISSNASVSDQSSERKKPNRSKSEDATEQHSADDDAHSSEDEEKKRRRRRGRRGGRNRRRRDENSPQDSEAQNALEDAAPSTPGEDASEDVLKVVTPTGGDALSSETEPSEENKPKRRTRRRRKPAANKSDAGNEVSTTTPTSDANEEPSKPNQRTRDKKADATAETDQATKPDITDTPPEEDTKPKPRRRRKKPESVSEDKPAPAKAENQEEPQVKTDASEDKDDKPRKSGWWSRSKLFGTK